MYDRFTLGPGQPGVHILIYHVPATMRRANAFLLANILFLSIALPTPYQLLGVPNDASQTEIRRAYRELAIRHHPDKKDGNETRL